MQVEYFSTSLELVMAPIIWYRMLHYRWPPRILLFLFLLSLLFFSVVPPVLSYPSQPSTRPNLVLVRGVDCRTAVGCGLWVMGYGLWVVGGGGGLGWKEGGLRIVDYPLSSVGWVLGCLYSLVGVGCCWSWKRRYGEARGGGRGGRCYGRIYALTFSCE